MNFARMKWPSWAKCRSGVTTAASTRHRFSSCWPARTYKRTGDRAFVESIWSNVQRALEWIDHYGDVDGDGFVEYPSQVKTRSHPSRLERFSRRDFSRRRRVLPKAPIALCEVQGYVYAAKLAASDLATLFGDDAQPHETDETSENLAPPIRRKPSGVKTLSTYAIALDGSKQPCRVRTSNAGHCLFAGIATEEHARRVATTLTDETSFSGWGIRTVASSEARYNPMSYHNGSVWPHDNSLIAAGFAGTTLRNRLPWCSLV